jgi:hypothetical protein
MTVETDLQTSRIKPLLFIRIDGLEPILCQPHHLGTPSGWDQPFKAVLHPPEEHSTDLSLGDMTAALSAMEFVLDDFRDTDGSWYFAKRFAPARWDTGLVARIAEGTAPNQYIDADATSIPVKSTAAFIASGEIYIGRETASFGDTAGENTLLYVNKGLYSAMAGGIDFGQTYPRYLNKKKGLLSHISQYPFTWVGRRVTLWADTWNEAEEKWNDDGASGPVLLWAGRIATDDSLRQDGKTGKWHLACTSIMEDLAKPIAEDMPYSYLHKINLQGDKGRSFICNLFSSTGTWVATITVTPDKGLYAANELLIELNDKIKSSNWTTIAGSGCDVEFQFSRGLSGGDKQVRLSVRPSGAGYDRSIEIIPDAKKGEFCHTLEALGFDGWLNRTFVMVQGGGDTPTGAYITGGTISEAYHPIDRRCNGDRLYVTPNTVEEFIDTQGDDTQTAAYISMGKAALISAKGSERYGTVYCRYTSKDGTNDYLGLDHVLNDNTLYSIDGYIRQPLGADKVKVNQCYIPRWDITGTNVKRGPFEQYLYPLISTGTSTYNEDDYNYDRLPFQCSVGIQESLVDVQSFLDADREVMILDLAQRELNPWPPGAKWIERIKEDCKLFGYAVVWRKGKIALKPLLKPDVDLVEVTLNETKRSSIMDFPDMNMGIGTVVNRYTVKLTRADTGYGPTIVLTDADSVVAHYTVKNVNISHNGIKIDGTGGATNVEDLLRADLLSRPLRFPSPVVTITMAHSLMYQVFVGDTVRFIASNLSDPTGAGERSINALAAVIGTNWNYATGTGEATLAIHGQYADWGTPYAPAALVDMSATNGGWDAVNYRFTLVAHEYGKSTTDPDDGAALGVVGNVLRVVERNPSNPTSPQAWEVEVAETYETDGAQILTVGTVTLTGWDGDTEYMITFADYTSASSAAQQQLGSWLADTVTETLDSGVGNDRPDRYG